MTQPTEKPGLAGDDKSQGNLTDGGPQQTPEGLKRQSKGPLDKDTGREQPGIKEQREAAETQPQSPGEASGK